jgi:tetratricopeptide (TPR) repeat protein
MLLATATMRLNHLNDSIGWLEKAARLRPDYPVIYQMLGLNYALGGALRESEQALRRAAELAPGNWEYQYLRGRALFELGRVKEAGVCLERAVELNRSSAKAWTALGQAQERLGENAAAETSYNTALAACGAGRGCAWPLLQLGFLYNVRSGPVQAAAFFRRAAEARPEWARPHFYLGKALAAVDDVRGARREFEEAVRLDESRSEYHYQLAQVYKLLGEAQKAGVQFARFRNLAALESHAAPAAEFAQP